MQQAQQLVSAMQAETLARLQQQQEAAAATTQQALLEQRAQVQQHGLLLEQQAAQQRQALEQHSQSQAAALSRTVGELQQETDQKLGALQSLLTGRVDDTSAGKAALTDAKLAELRCVCSVLPRD